MEKTSATKKRVQSYISVKRQHEHKPKEAEKYIEAIGRRKTSVARVRVFTGEENKKGYSIRVNGKSFDEYFAREKQRQMVCSPFSIAGISYKTSVMARGGGVNAQAESIRLGIARLLGELHPEHKERFRALSFLKRDPRMVERKKFGSRKARRPQQWRKR